MRSIWTVVSILAVANLLAMGGFVGWLVMTDRLNEDRVERIRTMLAETTEEEAARLAKEKAAAEAAAQAAAAEAASSVLPLGVEQSVQVKLDLSEVDRERLRRTDREVADLRRAFEAEQLALEEERERFRKEKAAYEAWRREIAETEGDDQFQKTLSVYEGLKPDKAGEGLTALLADGMRDQVVTYLSAMEERQRVKIMDEFVQRDPALAAELLEDLRRHGVEMPAAQGEP